MSYNPGASGISGANDVALSNPANSEVLKYNSSIGKWTNGAVTGTETAIFTVPGNLTTGTGVARYYVNGNYTISGTRASVGTAPTGSTIIVDINANGTSIFATSQANRPTIAASGFTALGGAPNTSTVSSGSYITVDIDQVGSTVAGANLTIQVYLLAS